MQRSGVSAGLWCRLGCEDEMRKLSPTISNSDERASSKQELKGKYNSDIIQNKDQYSYIGMQLPFDTVTCPEPPLYHKCSYPSQLFLLYKGFISLRLFFVSSFVPFILLAMNSPFELFKGY